MQDPECDGLVEKYKNADKQRCPPGLRRKPGVDQLGSSVDSAVVIAPRKVNTSTPPTPLSPETSPTPTEGVAVKSLLASLEFHNPDPKEEYRRLKNKRAIWESSLPMNFDSHSNHVTPGHTLEYINQGVPTPKKKMEDFNVSAKHKRRNSSQ